MSEYVLELQNIVKKYPGVLALNDVSLKLKKGQIGRASCRERV